MARPLSPRRGRGPVAWGTFLTAAAFVAGTLVATAFADFLRPAKVLSSLQSPSLPYQALLGQQAARQLQATGIGGDQQQSLFNLQPQPAAAAAEGSGQQQQQQAAAAAQGELLQPQGEPQPPSLQQQLLLQDHAEPFNEETLRGAPLVYVTFANLAFSEFLLNWVHSVEALGLTYLVGALDEQTAELCQQRGLPYRTLSFGNPEDVRIKLKVFRKIGAQKIGFVLSLLEDLNVQSVVVSDTDVVWLWDPSQYFQWHPAADWLISTDCASLQWELNWRADGRTHICQAFNTGVFLVRNREASLAILRRWQEAMLNPNPPRDAVTDQPTLVKILTERKGLPRAIPEDPRTIWAANNTLKLHPLPSLLFAGGHTAFVQRQTEALGVGPYSVHQTFLRRTYVHKHQREFKRARFREFGMWFIDEPSYFEGRFLSYDNDARRHIEELEKSRGSMQPLHKHWAAAAYQLAAFRDALAIAKLANRTLVLPPTWCWCDDSWDVGVLRTCHIYGVDQQQPFQCPADFIFAIHRMDAEGVSYRAPGFLGQPQVPDRIRHSKALVHVVPARPSGASIDGLGIAAEVWPGIQSSDVTVALAPFAGAAVLHIRGMQPGLFGGFSGGEGGLTNPVFDAMFQRITLDLYWCCTGFKSDDVNSHRLPHELPQPLAAGWRPWQPPQVQMPNWCKKGTPGGWDFVAANPNHPCNFANVSTAAVASRT